MPAYHPQQMLDAMDTAAQGALDRTAKRMARRTAANMLHVDPTAADAFGGRAVMEARLEQRYLETIACALDG